MEIDFKYTRFSPEITPFEGLAKEIAGAFGYTAELEVDKKIAQLLRLRVAQKSECSYCIILHAKTAREIGIPTEKVDNISSWYNSELYTKTEKTCIAYADAITDGINKGFQEHHDAMAAIFSEKQIAEFAAIVINMNLWTRLKLAQGQVPFTKN